MGHHRGSFGAACVVLFGCSSAAPQTVYVLEDAAPCGEDASERDAGADAHDATPETGGAILGAPCDPALAGVDCPFQHAMCENQHTPLAPEDMFSRCTFLCIDATTTAACATQFDGNCDEPFQGAIPICVPAHGGG